MHARILDLESNNCELESLKKNLEKKKNYELNVFKENMVTNLIIEFIEI